MRRGTIQSKIAGSRLALPATVAYGSLIWLISGVIGHGWWLQFGGFALCCYLMVLLNNTYALIRIYSRMVSCAFIVLNCSACYLFPSLQGYGFFLCMEAALLILFSTYQNSNSPGRTYYAFLFIGLGSLLYPQLLFYLPLLWILMLTNLMTLSWRTWTASLLGLLTPYWFGGSWLFYQSSYDFSTLTAHFSRLTVHLSPLDFNALSASQLLTLGFVCLLTVIGIVHYVRKSFADKIRTRMFFGCFIWLDLLSLVFLLLQPQQYDMCIRIMMLSTALLIAHFLALTSTRLTNIAFMALTAAALLLTVYQLSVWSL